MMQQDVSTTVSFLTQGVSDARAKPVLRGTIEAELLKMGYEVREVQACLDEFFKVVKH